MSNATQVVGQVAEALFTLKLHRGEGMLLIAMNWKNGQPPNDFVGFGIEYQEPGGGAFFPVKNRLNFDGEAGSVSSGKRPPTFSTLVAPIQKFRWVHFPFNAALPGDFTYRVTPIFMDAAGTLTKGVAQTAAITLAEDTYPGVLNVAFTRGFISSQAFVDNYVDDGPIDTLLPDKAQDGLTFVPTHPDAAKAYPWMGFEARREMLKLLDHAIADATAKVLVVAFDFNLPDILNKLKTLGARARVIIDNSKDHHGGGAAEDTAEPLLTAAGVAVKRQHMSSLQHNKTIVVDGDAVQRVICGSTNMSWRGLYVQSNNAMVLTGETPVKLFTACFETYWAQPDTYPTGGTFTTSPSAEWQVLGLPGIDARIAFSPHAAKNSVLKSIGDDIRTTHSSLFYSLAFLATTPGVIRDALSDVSSRTDVFVAGVSDQKAGVVVAASSSNLPPTFVAALDGDAPPPFSNEPTGLAGHSSVGTRMHHKFIVMDFNTPAARVYMGSYNMSKAADGSNGENLVLVRDQRVATSYMIEAVRIIDHYQFRVAQKAATAIKPLVLSKPPAAGGAPWFAEDYTDPRKINDRLLFA